MRDFKFRAWNKLDNEMHYNVCFMASGYSFADWIVFTSDKNKFDEAINNPYFRSHIKLMESTGLFDKDGTEIYEGDIVRTIGGESINGVFEFNMTIPIRDARFDMAMLKSFKILQVIGNKFENPDIWEALKDVENRTERN